MIDGYEYQKQKRKEAKELKKKNKKPMDEIDFYMWVFGVVIVLALIFAVVLGSISATNSRNSCESIGGEYKVVDREWSVATKTTVNVYGCVK